MAFNTIQYSWLHVTQSQVIIMNKIISTKDRLFMSVSGPSGSGKTYLIFQMFLKGTFYPSYNKIFYFYLHDQPKYRSFVSHNKFDIEFIKSSSFEIVNNLRDCMIVFDDTCEEIFNEKDFVKLATAGRHKNVHVIYVKHNLFQQSKQSRTIDLNTTHLILFKSPRDIQQIDYLGRQLNNAKFLRHAYQLATKEDFGHLLIDLDPKTSECLRYSSNIVPPSPTIFYLPSSKAVITSLENERERIMYIEANAQ